MNPPLRAALLLGLLLAAAPARAQPPGDLDPAPVEPATGAVPGAPAAPASAPGVPAAASGAPASASGAPASAPGAPASPPPAPPAADASSPAVTAAPAPAPAAPAPAHPSRADRLRIAGGAVLWYYQPLAGGGANNLDLFYANLVLDAKAGELGLHVEPRLRGTKLRPFFDGPTWIEEVYLHGQVGPVTIKTGKIYKQLGLFWDDSFYGSVLVYDGLKLSPDYGVSAEGEHGAGRRAGLRYFGQFFLVDGRTNVSLPGRDTISIPGARRRNEVVARVEPFARLGRTGVVKLGISGEYLQADLPEGTNDVFRAGADATVRTGAFGAWAEYLRQHGRSVDGFPIAPAPPTDTMPGSPGESSGRNDYVLAGASYAVGPVTARYNVSWVRYADLDIRETLHEPALGFTVSPNLGILAELVRWHRSAPSGSSTVDDSLNVTLNGHF
jgi:hypothetical protein